MALSMDRPKVLCPRRYSLSKWGRALRTALFLFLTGACVVTVAAPATEYEVKAAFIHNIAKFVEWPATQADEKSLMLCIWGKDPFGSAIWTMRDIWGTGDDPRDITWKILFANAQTNLKKCHVLFITASESTNLDYVLDRVSDSAVLTMGDTDGYAEQGVMVNFYLTNNKVRFEINPEAVRRAGLKIGSQLLKLARIVKEMGK
ncbi:YfiR family protein [Denitratisoma oestradiolicum]|uniref:Transmembrane protein n=2 Tax=Denitratisoma oestradiolicum TaxID=311182 RepID=A0A6S6Y9S0_9PROT|nr:YfiR family protein [Denitratisoma oestradiolicum]CAB1369332.1 conserved protein of unknown function [Denitratisoma oestradiolicum]